jgi:mediator of RNA polymerase II transcription subunit 14
LQFTDTEEKELDMLNRKRKLLFGDGSEPPEKRSKGSAYFVSHLVHVLAAFEDKIPFIALGNELFLRKLSHQGIQVEGNGAGLTLPLLAPPEVPGISPSTKKILHADLLSCKFRVQRKGGRVWLAEVRPLESLLAFFI